MYCLDEKTLSSYLDEGLSEAERGRIEAHLSECNHCLDLAVVAYEAQRRQRGLFFRLLRPFGPRNDKIRAVIASEAKQSQKKKRTELKWLLAALFFFALSFIFKGYFLQFLAAAVILGFKWAAEGEGAKRAIMIFKGIDQKRDFERMQHPTQK